MRSYVECTLKFKYDSIPSTDRHSLIYRNHCHKYNTKDWNNSNSWVFMNHLPPEQAVFWKKLQYIFIAIPKNATGSVQHTIPQESYFGHMLARSFPSHLRYKMKTICRNPYSRAVSAYLFVSSGGFYDNKHYKDFKTTYPTFERWVLYGLNRSKTLYHSPIWEPFVAQYQYIIDGDGNVVIDMNNVGRFEHLVADCNRLFDVNMNLHIHQSNNSKHWSSFYINSLVKEKIYSLYNRDFEIFGYDENIVYL